MAFEEQLDEKEINDQPEYQIEEEQENEDFDEEEDDSILGDNL